MSSVVYFLQSRPSGPIKIGTTTDLGRRMATLRAGLPITSELLCTLTGSRELESHFHETFKEHRLEGEWFEPVPELLDLIQRIKRVGDAVLPPGLVRSLREAPPKITAEGIRDEMKKLIGECGMPFAFGESKKALLARAAQRLGMSESRANDYWAKEVRLVPAQEADKMRAVALKHSLDRDYLAQRTAQLRADMDAVEQMADRMVAAGLIRYADDED